MTSISKNAYIDKLDEIVNKYNNTYHSSIKMKSADVKSSTYIDSTKDINTKDPKFRICDLVRISTYKFFLQKPMFQIGVGIFLGLKKFIKNTVVWTYVINDHKGDEIVGNFYEKELQKNKSKRV